VLLEDFHLQPHTRPLDSAARLGAYTHMATFVAIQAGRATADLLELERRLAGIAAQHTRDGCTIWGTSALVSDGVIVKGLSTTAHHIPATLAGFWSAARRFLTGEEAVPPRKIK
jgi:urease accessory protein UreH